MFSILASRKTKKLDLLNSQLFNERSFYPAFSKDIKKAKKSIVLESPFLTVKRSTEFANISKKAVRKGINIRVNTRHPDHHEGMLRNQASESIYLLRSAGIKVCVYRDMRHRKIAIIDKQILWEGSLNFLSHNNSLEIMRRTDSTEICKQMLSATNINKWKW
jgi:phosphatidylserine/phosphatidylglycerophosphate/cardiolipin synthase-like enzyme